MEPAPIVTPKRARRALVIAAAGAALAACSHETIVQPYGAPYVPEPDASSTDSSTE